LINGNICFSGFWEEGFPKYIHAFFITEKSILAEGEK
jgi:hypothetical protein